MKNVPAIQKEKTGFGKHYADMFNKTDNPKKGKKKSFIDNLKKRTK